MTSTLRGCSPRDGSLWEYLRWGYLEYIGHWSTPLGVSVFLDNSMPLPCPFALVVKPFPSHTPVTMFMSMKPDICGVETQKQ